MNKADILTFVNAQLNRKETNIDVQIQAVLDDLSDENLLVATDTSQSLSSGDTYLVYPANFKQVVAIVLNNGTYDGEPLKKVPGGHKQYRRWMENEGSSDYSEPEWYSEFDSKFFAYHPSDGTYPATIEHYKYHPQDVDSIEFGDEFQNAIYYGSAFHVALKYALERYIKIWGSMYEAEKFKRICNAPQQPIIVEG